MRDLEPISRQIAARIACWSAWGLTILLPVAVLLLASCAAPPTTPDPALTAALSTTVPRPQGTPPAQATPPASQWEPPPPPSFTPGPRLPLLTYEMSGGIAGRSVVFRFWDTGQMDKNDGRPLNRAAPGDYYHLLSLIDNAAFFSLNDRYDNGKVRDDIYDTITVNRGGRSKTVIVAEVGGRELAPPALFDLVAGIRRLAALSELPALSPGADDKSTITFEVSGLNEGSVLQIDGNGLASLYEYDRPVGTERLSDETVCALTSQMDAAGFFDLQDRYVYQNPPGVTSEMDYVTTTCTQGGRSKAVTTRGTSESPRSLVELEKMLQDIKQEVRTQGTPSAEPPEMIMYMYIGQNKGAYMIIDAQGGVHYSSKEPTAGYLSAFELKQLMQMLEQSRIFDSDNTFAPPEGTRDTTRQQRVIINYTRDGKSATVDAISGAQVGKDFDAILNKLNEIYGRFLPSKSPPR